MRSPVAVATVAVCMLAALAVFAWLQSREEPEPHLPEIEQSHEFAPVRSEQVRAPSPSRSSSVRAEPSPSPNAPDEPAPSSPAARGEDPAAEPELRTRVHQEIPSAPAPPRAEARAPSSRPPDDRTQIEKIQEAMRAARPRFRMCRADLQRSYPELTERIFVTLEVGLDEVTGLGVPSLAAIDSSELSAEDLECFAGVLGGLSFPPPVEDDEGNIGPYTISFPLVIDAE